MGGTVSFFLGEAEHHLQLAMDASARQDWPTARRHYLFSALYFLRAAKASSSETTKEQRLQQALALVERARQVGRNAPLAVGEGASDVPWLLEERPKVRFKDVAGLDEVKQAILVRMVYPFTRPDLAERYKVRTGGGILLYGPPGTGKTLLARAVAGEIDAAFFHIKPSDIMSKWVGEAEQNVAKLFAAARRFPRAVIFIDEIEALVPKRRSTHSTVMQRVVPEILQQLQGLEEHDAALLLIGATNEPWALDPAMLRPGRFDYKIYVPLPDEQARRRILEINLKDRPLAEDVDLSALARMTEGYSGADVVRVVDYATEEVFREAVITGEERPIRMVDFLRALEAIRPSVNPKDLKKFEEFARRQ